MAKSEVEKKRLGECTIMPQGCEISFMAWLKVIQLITYDIHTITMEIAGKFSHAAKKEAISDFLTFIDVNSHPNEEVLIALQQPTSSPKVSNCTKTPKRGVSNYEEKVLQSLVGI